jgi:hypothetical protein
MSYVVEADQSGRFEFTGQDAAFAYADGIQFSILIPATVRRECIRYLRNRGISGSTLYTKLFAVALFLLLKERIEEFTQVTIDLEYPGKEVQIKEYLINLFRRAGYKADPHHIQFRQIGKRSPAHRLALSTFRGEKQPDRKITLAELLDVFGQ